jgi:hypothetical protein
MVKLTPLDIVCDIKTCSVVACLPLYVWIVIIFPSIFGNLGGGFQRVVPLSGHSLFVALFRYHVANADNPRAAIDLVGVAACDVTGIRHIAHLIFSID